MRIASGLWNVIKREVRHITSRPLYLVGMAVVPICMALFFVSLLGEGLPKKVPAAVVDLDHSQTSRQLTRSLKAMELVDIRGDLDSYNKAIAAVQRGEIYGFFMIPDNFERDAVGGRETKLTFYSNLTFYVPGTLVFKGFKTMAVTTSGRIVQTTLASKGAPDGRSVAAYDHQQSSAQQSVAQLLVLSEHIFSAGNSRAYDFSHDNLCFLS